MIRKRLSLLSLSCVVFLLCNCQRPPFQRRPVKQAPITIDELAAELGVSSFCAEAHFSSPRYAQLVATITDSTGTHREEVSVPSQDTDFRLRVMLKSDPKSGAFQRLSFGIVARSGGGGQRNLVIEPESSFKESKTDAGNTFLYEITFKRSGETKVIHIELETSTSPFPDPSSK